MSDYQCRMKVGTVSSVYNNIELLYLTDMIQVVHYISDSVHYNDIKLHNYMSQSGRECAKTTYSAVQMS